MSTVERIMEDESTERAAHDAHEMKLAIATCLMVLLIGMFVGALLEHCRLERAAKRTTYVESARGEWP